MEKLREPSLRVLMTADGVGGVWSYALDLADALLGSGVEIALAVMGPPLRADQRAEAAAIPGLLLYESSWRLEWMQNSGADTVPAGNWLMEIARVFRPDIVHLNGYAQAALPWSVPVVVVAHSCVLSWWEAVKGEAAPPEWSSYRVAVAEGLANADAVVAPSSAMLHAVERQYGFAGEGFVIPNGCAPGRYRPERKEPVILAAGRLWDEGKNLAALEQAAAGLPWPIHVAGAAETTEGKSCGFSGLTLLGRLTRSELRRHFARAAIFAAPARYEPFGLAILEAAACGCALVLGDIPSLRELWDGIALFVAPDDRQALRAALQTLIEEPAWRAALGEAALERAGDYGLARMARDYITLYAELRRQHDARLPVAIGG
jgi:glycogen synthase